MTSLQKKAPGETKRSHSSQKHKHVSNPNIGSRPSVVVPATTRAKLKYSFIGTVAAATSYAEVVFDGCNLNDPGRALDTKQPIGFDELSNWYNSYRVHSSHIEVVCTMNSSSTTPVATLVGGDLVLYENQIATGSSLLGDAISQPRAKFTRLTLGTVAKLNLEGSYLKSFGLKPSGYDTTLSAIASFPTPGWQFHIGFAADAAYTSISFEYTVRIVYDVQFYTRKLIALSTYEEAMRKFLAENSNSWTASDVGDEKKDGVERTDAKSGSSNKDLIRAKPVPSEDKPMLSLSKSQVFPDSARDYAWVKLQTPLPKDR